MILRWMWIIAFMTWKVASVALAATPKTGILVHGCHLEADKWPNIMWGDEEQKLMGRLPHAIRLASQEGASLIVFGTGSSERDGVIEGRYGMNYLLDRWHYLGRFGGGLEATDLAALKQRLERTFVVDEESRNTVQELQRARALFEEAGCTRVILVSSPTHLPRCLRDACIIFAHSDPGNNGGGDDDGGDGDSGRLATIYGGSAVRGAAPPDRRWRPVLLASPCDTSYAGAGPADVAVVEPPHRGDRDRALDSGGSGSGLASATVTESVTESGMEWPRIKPLHALVGRALKVAPGSQAGFRTELDELLRRYGSH